MRRRFKDALNNPQRWRTFALLNAIAAAAVSVLAEPTGWVNSNGYISRISEVAWILGALSWWQSTRVEVRQDKDADVQEVLRWLKDNIGARDKT